ncbi:hypothetical protein [Bacillus badius]|uniref:Uncharacterized protein n=1 Tax=Bacillus badius TaxID=1455 RepID=A0ABR5ANK0_BACBA|nr:hypothetical protein [Bacillus badius]KIL72125.1 hypothetical protein SD77_3528 [Bacillus badius]MED4718623.1 hypothetical protein [Bacillus badius]
MNNGIYESRMEIQRLKERNAFLEEANAKLHFELSQLDVLEDKVQRYEKVLKEIVEYSKYEGNQWYENAKQALKG